MRAARVTQQGARQTRVIENCVDAFVGEPAFEIRELVPRVPC
jgi:hypothetical protein